LTLSAYISGPLVLAGTFLICTFAAAQNPVPQAATDSAAQPVVRAAASDLPDAPDSASWSSSVSDGGQQPGGAQTSAAPVHEDRQQKRIFGILPNFRGVTAGTVLPPQTVGEKFKTASEDSFDYTAFLLAAVVAVEQFGTVSTPEFGRGGVGYSRYLWHSFADQTSENMFVEFIIPSITHEDTRYYSLGKGGFAKRAGYSLSRIVVTRSDSGKSTFNASEVFGAGISAGVSNLYYPQPERTAGNTIEKWGTSIGIDAASFFIKEFSPDLYHMMFHKKTSTP
jgi:hypothetical protein